MKFGIAMAAKMPMIATTIISSIKVKPCCSLICLYMAAPLATLGVSSQGISGNQIHDSEGPAGGARRQAAFCWPRGPARYALFYKAQYDEMDGRTIFQWEVQP